ncbi:MAG: cellulase family glycosylhydrolase [Mangrovibacterium sp.]
MKKTVFLLLFVTVLLASAQSPIQLHPDNSHYFLYNGKSTILITSGEHYGAVLNLDFDYQSYLKTLAKNGLNLTRLFSGTYVEAPGAFNIKYNSLGPAENRYLPPWARSNISGYLHGGNKFDLDKWDPEYFERLKDFVETASQYDIVVEVVLFSSIYTEDNWRYNPFHPENNINGTPDIRFQEISTTNDSDILEYQKKVVRKIVNELNDYDNIYFEIQNEPWADHPDSTWLLHDNLEPKEFRNAGTFWKNRVDLANDASLKWQEIIVGIIADEESRLPKKHLIAQNYCNFLYPLKHVDPNVSILNFHYALPEAVTLNYGYNLPVSFDESGFSGSEDNSYRRQAWRFLMKGGAVFNGLDFSFYPGQEDGSGENSASGGGSPALRRQLGVLKNFLEGFDFVRMSPDHQTMIHSPGLFPAVLSEKGKNYAVYLEGENDATLLMDLPKGKYNVRWLNVLTGSWTNVERVEVKNKKSIEIKVPRHNGEIALEIKAKRRF